MTSTPSSEQSIRLDNHADRANEVLSDEKQVDQLTAEFFLPTEEGKFTSEQIVVLSLFVQELKNVISKVKNPLHALNTIAVTLTRGELGDRAKEIFAKQAGNLILEFPELQRKLTEANNVKNVLEKVIEMIHRGEVGQVTLEEATEELSIFQQLHSQVTELYHPLNMIAKGDRTPEEEENLHYLSRFLGEVESEITYNTSFVQSGQETGVNALASRMDVIFKQLVEDVEVAAPFAQQINALLDNQGFVAEAEKLKIALPLREN